MLEKKAPKMHTGAQASSTLQRTQNLGRREKEVMGNDFRPRCENSIKIFHAANSHLSLLDEGRVFLREGAALLCIQVSFPSSSSSPFSHRRALKNMCQPFSHFLLKGRLRKIIYLKVKTFEETRENGIYRSNSLSNDNMWLRRRLIYEL